MTSRVEISTLAYMPLMSILGAILHLLNIEYLNKFIYNVQKDSSINNDYW